MVVEFRGPSDVLGVISLGKTLSFNSTTIRSAVFFPRPWAFESIATSPLAIETFRVGRESDPRRLSAILGPMPETLSTIIRKKSLDSRSTKPYNVCESSR